MANAKSDLANVLNFLISNPRARSVARARLSLCADIAKLEQLASHVGVTSHSNLSGKSDLSASIETHLRNIYDMPLGSPAWQAFKNRDRRQLQTEYCKRHPNDIPTPSELPSLASLDLFLQQVPDGDPVPVSVDLICQPVPVERLEMAVKRGNLEIDCRNGTGSRLDERAAYPEPVTLERSSGKLQVSIFTSPQHKPSWDIAALSGPIGLFRVDKEFKCNLVVEEEDAAQGKVTDGEQPGRSIEEALCVIRNLAPGKEVAARFTVYVMDLEVTSDIDELDAHELDADEQGDNCATRSFLRTDGKPLSEMARKVITRTTQLQAMPGSKKGWITIAVAARRLGYGLVGDDR